MEKNKISFSDSLVLIGYISSIQQQILVHDFRVASGDWGFCKKNKE